MAASQRVRVLLFFMCSDLLLKKFPHGEPCRRRNAEHEIPMIAFLRRHYPDQVRGTGRRYVSSQPACTSAPWIVASSYHAERCLSIAIFHKKRSIPPNAPRLSYSPAFSGAVRPFSNAVRPSSIRRKLLISGWRSVCSACCKRSSSWRFICS